MNDKPILQGPPFVRRWMWATLGGFYFGFIGGFILSDILGSILPLIGIVLPESNYGLWIAVGAGVGLMQLPALRKRIAGSFWWVIASMVGLAVPFIAYEVVSRVWGVPNDLGPVGIVGITVAMIFGGALVGVLQLRVLRPHTTRSGRWVLASTVGWTLSLAGFAVINAMQMLGITFRLMGAISILVSPVIGGLAFGAVTGRILDRLLQPTK